MHGTAHHIIHAFKLILIAELNFAGHHDDGNNKLQKHLMIQVLDHHMGIVLAFFALHGFDPVGIEQRKDQGHQKDDNESAKRKIFNESKRFDFFFRYFGIHGSKLQ